MDDMVNKTKGKKTMNVMITGMVAAGGLAAVVSPIDADASSSNIIDRVLYIDNDYESDTVVSYLVIKEKDVEFTSGDTFRLTLPSGVKWLTEKYPRYYTFTNADGASFTVVNSTTQDLEMEISGGWDNGNHAVNIPLYFKVDGAEGDLKVTVDHRGSTLTAGQYTFAVVSSAKTSTTVSKSSTFSDKGGSLGTIRIDELAVGAMNEGEVVLTLPPNFKWDGNATVSYRGAFEGTADAIVTPGERKISIPVPAATNKGKLGTISIDGLKINIDKDAPFGPIEMEVSGEATSENVVIAKYVDYKTTVSVEEKEVPTLVAGLNNADLDDLETAEVSIKESLANTWASARNVVMEFPEWTKVVGFKLVEAGGISDDAKSEFKRTLQSEITGSDNVIEFTMPEASKKRNFKLKFYISSKADAQGDVTLKMSGKAGVEGEAVIAKVISPITVDVTKTEVRTGMKNQPLGDIILTETTKGVFKKGGKVELVVSDNVSFSDKPIVRVVEGDLKINESSIDVENRILSFEVDSESRKPSKISISGVKVDLDRTVPQGDIEVEVGGSALVQNQDAGNSLAFIGDLKIGDKTYSSYDIPSSSVDVGEFNRSFVAKKAFATVTTPAAGRATAYEVVFKVGEATYKIGDKDYAMDVAPFIEANRTYLPIRYIAESIGINKNNILWDEATGQVTIIKDNQVVQLTVGSTILKLNDVSVPMDTEAKNNNGRIVLPLRAVGQALGAEINWNVDEQTVTVK